MTGTLYITGKPDADRLLNTDGTALLIGMLLDQQVPMEWAFTGPATLQARLGHLDASKIAAMDQDEFVAVCRVKPAIHRFPASLGRRIHDLCSALVERFDGHGEAVWAGVTSGDELYDRLRTLPGYGDEKAKIFVAILGKRFGVQPERLAGSCGQVRRRQPAKRRGRHRSDFARQGSGVEEGGEGCQEGQAGPAGWLSVTAQGCWTTPAGRPRRQCPLARMARRW